MSSPGRREAGHPTRGTNPGKGPASVGSQHSSEPTVSRLLTAQAEQRRTAIAIAAPGRPPLAYARLQAHIAATVNALNQMGVGRNDRVALVLPQGPEMAVALLAAVSGVTCVPLNPALRAREWELCFADLNPSLLIIHASIDDPARAVAKAYGIPLIELVPDLGAEAGLFRLVGDGGGARAGNREAQPDDPALMLYTSGTTARPKCVPLTHANLCASAKNIRDALDLDERDRCLNVMPLFHIHGIMVTLASLLAGGSVGCVPEFDVAAFFPWLEELAPTWYSAVPTIHHAIAAHAAFHLAPLAGHSLRFIRSCSAPLPNRVAAELEQVFGVPVIEAYGMTEAAHQITSNPLPPRDRKAGSVGVPAGMEVAILDASGNRLPTGQPGEVAIRGASVMRGYENDPAATADVFRAGWFRTGDLGRLDPDGYLFLSGRIKEIINRGGEKVSPREVDDVLLAHPAIAEAATFPVPHPALGEDTAAAVVLREHTSVTEPDLRAYAASRLADFKLPRRILIVDAIPKGLTGKLDRARLAEQLGVATREGTRPEWDIDLTPPRTPVEEAVAGICCQVLGLPQIGAHDNLFHAGGDSISATLIISRVRETLNVELSITDVFASPTVAGLADRIEAARMAPGGHHAPSLLSLLSLLSLRRKEELPPSFGQESLWFLDQVEPGIALYNMPMAFRLAGHLDQSVLARSLTEIMRRHEVLRTTFGTEDGRPVQVIGPAQPVSLPLVDLRHLPEAEREAEARRHTEEEARRPFDLSRGPMLRATLFRLADEDHVFLMTTHQIACDGWSRGILYQELATLYGNFVTGHPADLPALPVQYADYAAWQRQRFQGEIRDAQLAYWRRQLAGAPAALDLPADRPRPTVQTFRGAQRTVRFPKALSEALGELSRREGVTLFMILLAAFQTLLHRYTGQDDIVVGSPIAGRNRVELERLVGLFVNTLVLRTNLSGNPSFRELLARVRAVATDAYLSSDLPFGHLVRELQPDRQGSRPPLAQVIFELENLPTTTLALPGLTVSPLVVDTGTATLDLTVELKQGARGLTGFVEYNTDLFDAATIDRMLAHFQTLLEGIVKSPDTPIGRLPLLAEAERQQLLVEWNRTQADFPRDACVHELFETQVARTPDATAVVFEDAHLTYGELNRRATQVAHALRTLGVAPDSLVGLCVERSLDMVAGLLGILKAGGAYLPLDPAYPRDRLAFMLQDAGVRVVLTHRQVARELPHQTATIVDLDSVSDGPIETTDVFSRVAPESLAYVLYTSGSTGRPKGVAISHRALVNCLQSFRREPGMCEHDVLLATTTLSFDIASLELLLPLLVGARVVVVGRDVAMDPQRLAEALRRSRATVMQATPTTWRFLVDAGWEGSTHLRALCGGETLPRDLADHLLRRTTEVWNLYGPTETTIYSTRARVEAGNGPVPIGRPIANTQVYVLDRHGQPVPIGVPGELYIGGLGLAQGYLNRPELTAEKFIPSPFDNPSTDRLYKTGDLARYLPDGNIEFLGRLDNQLKIRGVRIEPEEIETALRQHSSVRECIVTAHDDHALERGLVAYVVLQGPARPAIAELREFLGATLPQHMLPNRFVILDALPLTPAGKIDRRALPGVGGDRPRTSATYVEPRNPTERVLSRMWAEVLGVERVGADDDFLELGGHSLLAIRLIGRIRDAFDVELSPRRFFEAPTVAAMAQEIASIGSTRDQQPPPIQPVARNQTLCTSFEQEQLWIFAQRFQDLPVYNETFTIRMGGPVDTTALGRSLNEILRRHEVLRTGIVEEDGRPVQTIHAQAMLRLPLIDLRGLPASDRELEAVRLATTEAQRPFDLPRPPMLRALLLCLGETDYRLYLAMHHITIDAFGAYNVLVSELCAMYEAFRAGRRSPLAEPPIQYADFAHWQREWMKGPVLQTHLSYWKKQLAGAPVLELPTDRPRPPVQTFRGAQHCLSVPKDLTDALNALSRREGVTLYMTLLAGFKILLWRYSGQDDIVLGTVASTRIRPEMDALLGYVFNTLALRTDLSGNPTFRQLLLRVREVTLEAVAHQHVPFMEVVHALQPRRDPRRHPLFDVMFAMEPTMPIHESGWTISQLDVHPGTAKFDLTLELEERTEGIVGCIEYSTDLFDPTTIRRLEVHWLRLLGGIVEDPNRPIAELPLLTSDERQQHLVEWNRTQTDSPRNVCIHELFEAQVDRTPDAIAVVFEDAHLTYGELNRRANQLAHALRKLGVAPDTLVGICVERSLDMVVGLLGILKAGGAYVPLDPGYPQQRLAFMLADCQAPVLVTQSSLTVGLPAHRAQVVRLDADWPAIAQEPQDNPRSGVTAEKLAYVIYTSGSTGSPKGVMISHCSICNYVHWMGTTFPQAEGDAILQKTSLSFDPSVWEVFGPLSAGARLVLARPNGERDSGYLIQVIADHNVTIVHFVPSQLRDLLEEPGIALCASLRHVFCGGEVMTMDLQNQFFSRLGAALHNAYGPTEATIDATYWTCAEGETHRTVPIGHPISNTQVYVLDQAQRPVPIGVPGEIYLGGLGIARGYLNHQDLTSESFIPNPFSDEPGSRLFRTGDIARYLPDGILEFLGRRDHQVKLRGFRVELGEIEAGLRQHPQVQEAVVVVQEDRSGDARLVAYLVPIPGFAPTPRELREFLVEKLPAYMLPAAFVLLDALPLTPNGKVDRRALPNPSQADLPLDHDFVPPRTPVEKTVAAIWGQVLGVERVGLHDDFFASGGHSLLATQLVARVRAASQVELPLRVLFDAPTVAGVAAVITELIERGPEAVERLRTPADPMQPENDVADRFLTGMIPKRGGESHE